MKPRTESEFLELIRIIGFRQWLYLTLRLDVIKEWFERVYYCHHNARVIADFEHRMACVLCECTSGMSKPYYTKEAMIAEIQSFMSDKYNEAYADGVADTREEHRWEASYDE